MLGLRIFIHALRQVFGNFRAALQISGLIYFILFACSYAVVWALDFGNFVQFGARETLLVVLLITLWMVGFLWIAVAWHRYVLLNETPRSVLPKFHGKNIASYFFRGLLIALVFFLIAAVLLIIWLLFNSILFAVFPNGITVGAIGMMLVPLVLNIVFSMVFFSLSPVLVAGALGRQMSFREAQSAFSGKWLSLFVLLIVTAAFSTVVRLVAELSALPLLDYLVVFGILQAALYWVSIMTGISVLTTLYGHFIEKRELV